MFWAKEYEKWDIVAYLEKNIFHTEDIEKKIDLDIMLDVAKEKQVKSLEKEISNDRKDIYKDCGLAGR